MSLKFIIVSFIVFGPLFYSCLNQKSRQYAQLKFTKDTFYITNKNQGNIDTCKIEYSNIGDAPLKILNAEGSCGCTTLRFDTSKLLPHQNRFVTIFYNHDGDTSEILKNVVFLTDGDPQFKVLYLQTVNNHDKK